MAAADAYRSTRVRFPLRTKLNSAQHEEEAVVKVSVVSMSDT